MDGSVPQIPDWACRACGRMKTVDRHCAGCNAVTEFCGRCDAGCAALVAWDAEHAPHIEAHTQKVSDLIHADRSRWLRELDPRELARLEHEAKQINTKREGS